MKIFWDEINAILQLAPNCIKFLDAILVIAEVIKNFHEFIECNVPQVCPGKDATNIEILSPSSENKLYYISRKQKYKISTQAGVGSDLFLSEVVVCIT